MKMSFNDEQKNLLSQPINPKFVKTRKGQGNRDLAYLESWVLMSNANRIFGPDGWSSETIELREVKAQKGIAYIARVRVTAGGVVRDGVGGHSGFDHENTAKSAESDARKRALSSFGNQFGLSLYDGEQGQSSTALLKSTVTLNTQQSEKESIENPPVDPAFIKTYLGDLVNWAREHPTLLEGLKQAYRLKFPDFEGSFSNHVQEQKHIEFIDGYTNRLT
tara:strand:+ start:125 stop:784 length:660 start_codon:yes stop_codon:yes gene_type:complete